MRHYSSTLFAAALIILVPRLAEAQYKNSSFGLDVGYWLVSQPTTIDSATESWTQGDRLPLRVKNGVRFGGESNFKMDEDHFWFSARVNAGFLQFPLGNANGTLDERFDADAHRTMGTIFGVEGLVGIRYVALTDNFRPYVQGGLSFLRLMSFASSAGASCDTANSYCAGGTNQDVFLPHANVGGLHLQPGVELILKRDIAINIFVDLQRWLIFNATDNTAVVAGVGVLFFG